MNHLRIRRSGVRISPGALDRSLASAGDLLVLAANRIPRTAVLKIVEPYFSQLSESGLPQWPYPPPRPIDTVTRCT